MPKKAILCVDDEKIVLSSLKSQIRKHFGNEFTYEFAQSAEEAEEVMEEFEEDGVQVMVVVSDWLMPGVKGDEFLIRVHEKYPEIVKFLLTGQADEAAVERARENANLQGCLHKPWTEQELIRIIQTGLEVMDNE
ncbi:MAG: response regulator [Desulfobacterales bacterium]|nr:response regulator [Desulfobacterales bacterium]